MRIALISDIHANEVALNAVLKEIDRSGVDRIVCLGDITTLSTVPEGSNPSKSIGGTHKILTPAHTGTHQLI